MKHLFYIFLSLLLLFIYSCSKRTYQTVYPTLSDGKYDSEFPYRNCSEQLATIAESIKKISCFVIYEVYEFDASKKILRSDINDDFLTNHDLRKDISSKSVIGTATIIYKDLDRVALLTCAHTVSFQDTIFSIYQSDNTSEKYIKTIAIKKQQRHYIPDMVLGEDFEILVIDKSKDIAILGSNINTKYLDRVKVFPYPIGKSKELEWGSFVYIMGFPMGQQMITRGIISNPAKMKSGVFLIDAVFNHGFSGGLVLAIKDGVPNFEMVGMVKAASASYDNYLIPEQSTGKMIYGKNLPYENNIYIEAKESINYGVTFSITMETLQEFYKKNKTNLLKKGYDLSSFFGN